MLAMGLARRVGRQKSFGMNGRDVMLFGAGGLILLLVTVFLWTQSSFQMTVMSVLMIGCLFGMVSFGVVVYRMRRMMHFYFNRKLSKALQHAKKQGIRSIQRMSREEYVRSRTYQEISEVLTLARVAQLPPEWLLPLWGSDQLFHTDDLQMLQTHLKLAETRRNKNGISEITPLFQNLEQRVHEILSRRAL